MRTPWLAATQTAVERALARSGPARLVSIAGARP
jgi:hypothetical protein